MSGTYTSDEKVEYALKTALFRTMQSKDQPSSLEKSAPPRIFPKNIMKVNLIEKGEGDIDEDGYYVGRATASSAYNGSNDLVNLEEPELTISNYRIIDPTSNKITDKRVSDLTTVTISETDHSSINALPTTGTTYPLKNWFFRGHYGSHSGTAAFNAANSSYDGLQLAWDKSTVGATATEEDIVPHLKFYLQVQTNFTNVAHGDNITYGHDLMKGLIGLDQNFSTTIQVVQGEGGSCATLGTTGASTGDFWFTQATSGTLSFYGVTNKVNASASLSNLATTKFPMISFIRYTGETGFGAGSGGGGSATVLTSADSNVSAMISGTAETMPTQTFEFDGNVGIGTTSPHQLLTVRASSGTNYDGICLETNTDHRRINMASSGSGGTGNAYLQMWGSDNNSSSETQHKILLHTGADSYFNGGNVGIGTTDPGNFKLKIYNSTGTNTNGSNGWHNHFCVEEQTLAGSGITFKAGTHTGYIYYGSSSGSPWVGSGSFGFATTATGNSSDIKMVLKNDGNLGIGTTSPGRKLSLAMPDNTAQDYMGFYRSNSTLFGAFGYNTSFYMFSIENIPVRFGTHNTERMRIQGNGDVGIGTTSPGALLDVNGQGWCRTLTCGSYGSFSGIDGGDGVKLQIGNSGNNSTFGIEFSGYTNGHRGGNQALAKILCKSNDSNNYENHIIVFKVRGWGTNGSPHHQPLNERFWFYGSGSATCSAWNTSSDDRVKHNERNITNAMNIINKLNAKLYFKSNDIKEHNYDYDLDNSGNPITDEYYRLEAGFIAQEVREIPELKYCVEGKEYVDDFEKCFKKDASGNNILDENNEPVLIPEHLETIPKKLSLSYTDIFVYNVVATQELDKRVNVLESENAELKTKNTELENKVVTLESELAAIKQHLGI